MPGEHLKIREAGAAAALLTAILLVQIAATRAPALFTHPLWLDETLTWTITNDPNFAHAMAAVRGGVETNPPTMYLILWPIAKLAGGMNEFGLRAFSFVSIVLALTGVYAICRRYFDRVSSTVGTLVLAAHPLIIFHAFEARFYGPWLAATVWYIISLLRLRETRSVGALVVSCILAMLASTLHYFGVIAIVSIGAADLLFDRRPLRQRSFGLIPPALGILASFACIPFILGQRAGLHVRTWLEPTSLSDVKDVLIALFGPMSLLVVLLMWWAWRVIERGSYSAESQSPRELRDLAGVTSLLLFPVVIVTFSYLVQPAARDRYLLLAVAPLAPLAADLASRTPRWVAMCMFVALLIVGAAEVKGRLGAVRGLERDMQTMIAEIEQHAGAGEMIVFKRRVELYPLARARPQLLERSVLLDFDTASDQNVRPFSVYERDMARKFAEKYDRYALARLEALPGRFVLVAPPDGVEQSEVRSLLKNRTIVKRGVWTCEIRE